MSRYWDRDEHEQSRPGNPQSQMHRSQGRGGGAGSGEANDARIRQENSRAVGSPQAKSRAELARIIDEVAADRPTMSDFIERLEKCGVEAIPSLQSNGRLNGMCYRIAGRIENGSTLGRAYTALGLQQIKGVRYDPARDDSALRRAVERAGIRRPDRVENTRDQRGRHWDRESGLSADQRAVLAEVGKFRTVRVDDLIRHQYAGNTAQFRQDMRVFSEQNLADRRTIRHAKSGRDYEVVVLTRRGKNRVKTECKKTSERVYEQQFYAGFVKPDEVRHDVGIYRMYQAEAERIEREGGTIKRVVLDFELKKRVFSELNKSGRDSGGDYAHRKREIAEENGLKVVEGRIVFPDLRIEYETRDLRADKVDLELATGSYKAGQMRAKNAAGLKIYAPDSAAGSPAIQDRELSVGVRRPEVVALCHPKCTVSGFWPGFEPR
jgi:hypothetical protein